MTIDDEFAFAESKIFENFERRDSAGETALQIRSWIFSIFCWDGILPVAAMLLPALMSIVVGKNDAVEIITAVAVPIFAFFIRVFMGRRYFANRDQYVWQRWLFYCAIFYFVAVESLLILFGQIEVAVKGDDWYVVGKMYAIYLAAMAVALCPLRWMLGPPGKSSRKRR